MLKLLWTPAAAAAPDADAYKRAADTLSSGDAILAVPRDRDTAFTGRDALRQAIRDWLARRSLSDQPVKLMLHGFDYDPREAAGPDEDPYSLVYGYPGEAGPNHRLSWLPLVRECDEAGRSRQETAIAFAWVSTGSLTDYAGAGWGEPYQYACVDLVCLAARAVAEVLRILADEGARVDVLAHSLGTRLFTQAVAAFGPGDGTLNNVVLLDGAEFSVDAAATFAGRGFSVVNVTNEEDKVLVAGAEQLGDPSRLPGTIEACSLGRYGLGTVQGWEGIAAYPPNWVDIALDRQDVQAWFKANGGYTLTATDGDRVHPSGGLNHWACYTEPGNRAWLTDLLWKPGCNGAAFAAIAGLPKGRRRASQPVFAGVGIPGGTPMTMDARIALQRGNQGGAMG